MTGTGTPVSALPSRPLAFEEIDNLQETARFESVFNDDTMVETEGDTAFAHNCILITEQRVAAVVFDEDDETWYRVYSEPRSRADITDAYDAVREVRDEESLFDRHPRTIEEAVFMADRPTHHESSGYEEGDSFACPVCGDTHIVQFDEDELMRDHPTDTSTLYVTCPDARNTTLTIEYQASTPD